LAFVAEASPTGAKVAKHLDGAVRVWSNDVHDIIQSVETGVSTIPFIYYEEMIRERRNLHLLLKSRDKTGEVGAWVSDVLDQAFLAVTEPDTKQVLQRANLLFSVDDPAHQPWVARLPKRGPTRDDLEKAAERWDEIRRAK
jgi:hypothetical protein